MHIIVCCQLDDMISDSEDDMDMESPDMQEQASSRNSKSLPGCPRESTPH